MKNFNLQSRNLSELKEELALILYGRLKLKIFKKVTTESIRRKLSNLVDYEEVTEPVFCVLIFLSADFKYWIN